MMMMMIFGNLTYKLLLCYLGKWKKWFLILFNQQQCRPSR